jgi:zinc protease
VKLSISIVLLAALAACTPRTPGSATRAVLPTLPGDGDANVTRPPDVARPGKSASDPWSGRDDLIKAPPAQPPQAVQLPPIERFKLPNGLQVVVVKDDRLPVVTMQLMVRAGRAEEPLARLGVAELTADLLPKGTRKRDALAIARTIDLVGGAITASTGYEATWLTCATMSKDAKTCLELMPEMVTQPTFTAVELERARQNQLAQLSRRLDDAGALAGHHAQNLVWGNEHVRGWVTSAAWLRRLERTDVVAWHKTWFVPGNAVLAVAGDVDVARLKKDLARAFGGWAKGPIPARPRYVAPRTGGVKIRLVDKPGQTQTQIRVVQLGLSHDDSRFFPALVWNYALGGGAFSSRLMTVVRSEAGKTYGASSTFDRNADRGSFVAATFTRTAETVATLKLVLDEIKKMHAGGPSEAEVGAAIANLAGSYAMRVSGADDLAAALVTADLHGLSQTYVSDFPLLVAQVTRQDAAEAAGSILDPGNFGVVLLGDGDAIAKQLTRAGLPFERVAFDAPIGPQPDAPAAPVAPVDPATAKAGVAILDAALLAKGGDKVAKLRSLRMTGTGQLTAQGQTVDVELVRTLVVPDKMRMEIRIAKQFEIVFALDGGKGGWTRSPAGLDDLPAAQLPELERQRWVDPELVLVRHQAPGAKVALLPAEKLDGKTLDVVRVTSADGGHTTKLYFDPTTKMLVAQRYPSGAGETVERFDDYRAVAGIQIAHRRVSTAGGEKSDLTVDKVEIDPTIAADVFTKPAS